MVIKNIKMNRIIGAIIFTILLVSVYGRLGHVIILVDVIVIDGRGCERSLLSMVEWNKCSHVIVFSFSSGNLH